MKNSKTLSRVARPISVGLHLIVLSSFDWLIEGLNSIIRIYVPKCSPCKWCGVVFQTRFVFLASVFLASDAELFFECPFASSCWIKVGIIWNNQHLIKQRIILAAQNFTGPCFMEVMACVSWNVWKIRNDLIFNQVPSSFRVWKVKFQSDMLLHQHRVKANLVAPW